jgi:hypothetical protein
MHPPGAGVQKEAPLPGAGGRLKVPTHRARAGGLDDTPRRVLFPDTKKLPRRRGREGASPEGERAISPTPNPTPIRERVFHLS